ncbi:cellulose binding domain-containing protein [Agromyces sp. CCNWLW203]|uniref:cellulose binding domain-containing protein n=1 Tax=Agromyces sp. CCNWLW203 TaxID=3112842 RepID=UPI003FA577F1
MARSRSTGATATVINESWNGDIAAGGTEALGFTGTGTAPSTNPVVACAAE